MRRVRKVRETGNENSLALAAGVEYRTSCTLIAEHKHQHSCSCMLKKSYKDYYYACQTDFYMISLSSRLNSIGDLVQDSVQAGQGGLVLPGYDYPPPTPPPPPPQLEDWSTCCIRTDFRTWTYAPTDSAKQRCNLCSPSPTSSS